MKKNCKVYLKCIIGISILLTSCLALSATAFAAPPSIEYELVYEDDFNGTSLNTNEWMYRQGTVINGLYQSDNVSVSDGYLHLKFDKENVNGSWRYTTGGIISKQTFGYGYYEVKAKLYGGGPGLHQSFWQMGWLYQEGSYVPEYNTMVTDGLVPRYNDILEIDGFESASDRTILASNAHWHVEGSSIGSNGYAGIDPHAQDFVYGYEWLPTQVKFYCNGVLVRTMAHDKYYAPQYEWLTATCKSGVPNDSTLPGDMKFDYFKYYAKPDSSSSNLLGNGDFEYNLWRNAVIDNQYQNCWIENTDEASGTLESVDGAYSGTYYLQHKSTSPYNITTKQNIQNLRNSTYKLTAMVKSSGGQSSAKMSVLNYGGNELSANIPQTGIWTQITIDNIPVTANNCTIAFSSNASSNQWIEVDNVVFKEKIPPSAPIIDNGDNCYSEYGNWTNSGLTGYNGSSTRYSGSSGAYAKWTPIIGTTGDYDIYIYKIVNLNSDTNAKIDIVYDGGTNTQYLNYTTGTSGWVYLGSFNFAEGTGGYVKNSLNTAGKYARADAVKFIKK